MARKVIILHYCPIDYKFRGRAKMFTSTKNTVLFLHGGPCSSAKFERLHLNHINDIIWWDQPRENPENPWPQLLSAAMRKLDESVNASGGPVHVLTSSFGAQIGTHLACSHPEKVCSLVLLAPVFDVGAAYAGLGEAELAARPTDELSEVVKGYRSCPSVETLWPMVGKIFASPRVFEFLWGQSDRAKVDQFVALVSDAEMFDPHFFQITVNSFLATGEQKSGRYTGPVTAIFGRADPLVSILETVQELQLRFPQAKYKTVDAGHFPHLEVPLSEWHPVQLSNNPSP